MSEEYIDTTKGYLTAELCHSGAKVAMKFDNNYHVPVQGKANLEQLHDGLSNYKSTELYIRGGDCNFHITEDNHGECILIYKGYYRNNVSVAVTLTEAGRLRLIEILEAGINQALTPEQIAKDEEDFRQWQAKQEQQS